MGPREANPWLQRTGRTDYLQGFTLALLASGLAPTIQFNDLNILYVCDETDCPPPFPKSPIITIGPDRIPTPGPTPKDGEDPSLRDGEEPQKSEPKQELSQTENMKCETSRASSVTSSVSSHLFYLGVQRSMLRRLVLWAQPM